MRDEFYYPSRDGITHIHGMEWKPDGPVKAVLQICHGMAEYIERYDEFASFLAEKGCYVVGHDHLGHGKSVQDDESFGFFHETKGNQYVIGDIHKLREMTEEKYPDASYFMMGHSMGSFLLRQYLTVYGKGLAGAMILGTGYKGWLILNTGQIVCRIIAAFKGWKYRSSFVNNLGIGGYNKRFEPSQSTKDWVTSDPELREIYEKDPLCNFVFTINGYYQMFCGMKELTKKENMDKIPKDLPVIFAAGGDDPVGGFGKDVQKVYEKYKDAGKKDVEIKLYQGDRHEILNETDREQVYEDLYQWLELKLKNTNHNI